MKVTSLRINEIEKKEIDNFANKIGKSRSALIREAIKNYLEKYEKTKILTQS